MKTSNSNKQNDQDMLQTIPKSHLETQSFIKSQKTTTKLVDHNKLSLEAENSQRSFNSTSKIVVETNGVNTDSINQIPDFYSINLNYKSLISNYKEANWFNTSQNKTCYIVEKQEHKKEKTIFLANKNHITQSTGKDVLPNENIKNHNDWTLIPLLLGFFVLTSILTIYRKYLGQLFHKIFHRFSTARNQKEKSIPYQRLTIILDFLFVISLALLIDQVVKKLELYSPPERFPFLIFIIFCAFLTSLRVVRWFIFKLSALFADKKSFFNELYSNSNLYTRSLGVFLLPTVFFITYTTGFISTLLIYLSVLLTIIVLIFRLIRIFKVFVVSGFSILYFILYLCALEIAPLLFIWKEVSSR